MKFILFLLFALSMAVGVHALDLSITAQALGDSQAALLAVGQAVGTTPTSWITFLLSLVVGLVLSPYGQNLVEGLVGQSPNFMVKLFAPTILGAVTAALTAWAGKSYGITPASASTALAAFLGGVHWFNGTIWAADIKKANQGAGVVLDKLAAVDVTKA